MNKKALLMGIGFVAVVLLLISTACQPAPTPANTPETGNSITEVPPTLTPTPDIPAAAMETMPAQEEDDPVIDQLDQDYADLSTYENPEFGVSFEYPSRYLEGYCPINTSPVGTLRIGSRIELSVLDSKGQTASQFVETELVEMFSGTVILTEPWIVGEKTGVSFQLDLEPGWLFGGVVEQDGSLYLIHMSHRPGCDGTTDSRLLLLVMESFRFIESVE